MPVSFYEIVWVFMIYAFLGWCTEVAYAALELKEFVNRGFLNGPVCPIYGCGVLVVLTLLEPLKQSFLLLFIGSFFLTSILEFFTGFLLEKIFHNQWWDYSDENFNICGYVCLKFSILWGLGCTLIVNVIHPNIDKFINILPKIPGTVLLALFSIVFLADLVITAGTILRFNKRLKLLDEAASKIKIISDEIGENIYEGVTAAVVKGEEFKESIEIKSAELKTKSEEFKENIEIKSAELRTKGEEFRIRTTELREEKIRLLQEYERLMGHKSIGMKRLMKAFPKMKSEFYQETLIRWKNYRNEKKER